MKNNMKNIKTIAKRVWYYLNKERLVVMEKSVLWLAIFWLLFSFPNLLLAENKSCEETWHISKEWKLLPPKIGVIKGVIKGVLTKVAFFSDDNLLLIVYGSGGLNHIGIWEVSKLGIVSKKLLDTPLGKPHSESMDLLPVSGLFAYGCKRCPVRIIDLKKGLVIKEFRTKERGGYQVAFSPDGKMLAIGGERKAVSLYDIISQQELAEFSGYKSSIRGISFSPDGNLLSVSSYDGQITIWDIPKREKIFAEKLYNIAASIVFSPDGKLLLTSGCSPPFKGLAYDCEIKILNLSNFSEVIKWNIVSLWMDPLIAAFSPTEPLLAIGEIASEFKGKLTLWCIEDPTNKKIVQSFDLPFLITSLNFSSDGKKLVVGLFTGEVFFISKDIFTQLESDKN